jgi:hypothetical protein
MQPKNSFLLFRPESLSRPNAAEPISLFLSNWQRPSRPFGPVAHLRSSRLPGPLALFIGRPPSCWPSMHRGPSGPSRWSSFSSGNRSRQCLRPPPPRDALTRLSRCSPTPGKAEPPMPPFPSMNRRCRSRFLSP